MKTLAIDYGEKYYGIAISDENSKFATTLDTIVTRKQDVALKRIMELVGEHNINRLLIGLPLGLDNKPTQISLLVEDFIEKMQELTNLPIITWNEVLTSRQAAENIINKHQIHSEAARIMLQEFLDHEQTTKPTQKI